MFTKYHYFNTNTKVRQFYLEIPILAIGGEAAIGNFTTMAFQKVANNVTGITLPNTGHFIPEERPNLLVKEMLKFLSAR